MDRVEDARMGAQIKESTRELEAALGRVTVAHRAARRWNRIALVTLAVCAVWGCLLQGYTSAAYDQVAAMRLQLRAQAATSEGWESEVRLLAGAAVDARQAELAAKDDRDRWRALALARWHDDPAAQAADFLRTFVH